MVGECYIVNFRSVLELNDLWLARCGAQPRHNHRSAAVYKMRNRWALSALDQNPRRKTGLLFTTCGRPTRTSNTTHALHPHRVMNFHVFVPGEGRMEEEQAQTDADECFEENEEGGRG